MSIRTALGAEGRDDPAREDVPPAELPEEQPLVEQPPAAAAVPDDALRLRLLEAVLFTAAQPLSEKELAERLPEGHGRRRGLRPLLEALAERYAGRGVNLVCAGETWAFSTAPDLGPLLALERRVERKLSRAAVETLAVIAYHQPVTRAEIEEIRGVQVSKGTLDALFEQGWVVPVGRREAPGRPTTWGTTDSFLRQFGLAGVADLPRAEELRAAGLLDARPAIAVLQEIGAPEAPGLAPADEGDAPAEPLTADED